MLKIVKTKNGYVEGAALEGKNQGVVEFRRIPYAKPPVGELRWKPPVPADSWEGVLDCTQYPDIPMQLRMGFATDALPMSEDCLYLIVTTAAETGDEKLPVYMWFHGGALENGSAYSVGAPKADMAKKGCIVVSVAQRLNVFGYMALPQLSAEQGGKSGNYGLMDELLALNWVRENISAFGGDPEKITIGGQSGGTDKCSALAACPKAKGMIRGVITESGLKWAQKYKTLEEKEKSCREYLRDIGIDPDMPLEELRRIDASVLMQPKKGKGSHGEMVCDGDLITGLSTKEIFEGALEGVSFLCGTNFGEAKPIPAGLSKEEAKAAGGVQVSTAAEFYEYYRKLLGGLYEKYHFEKLVPVTDENAEYTLRRLASLGLNPPVGNNSSRSLMIPRVFGAYLKKRCPESRVYAYLFDTAPLTRPGKRSFAGPSDGVYSWHSCELMYAYNVLDSKTDTFLFDDKDYELAEKMSSYWSNFVKYGDPNGEGLVSWPDAAETGGYLMLGDEIRPFDGFSELDKLIFEFVVQYFPI